MPKFMFIIIAISLILLMIGFIAQRHALARGTVQLSSYEQVAPNIFASPSVENVQQSLKAISEGKERVDSTFGEMIAAPKIIFVSSQDEANKFGANLTATTHYTPLGTCIVFGPEGQNVNVAAHELIHSEVAHRVDWLTHWLKIPVWFNEGIALMVDYRKPFLVEKIQLNKNEVEAVKRLGSGKEFFGGTDTHNNYLASRLAVINVDPLSLYKKLKLIRNGESFESAFKI